LAWLAFTKKSQIRNIALLEFKHLFNQLQNTSGVPATFWNDPYAVGFISGYTMGVGLYVAGKAVKPADVNSALVDVLFQLVPSRAHEVAAQFAAWDISGDPAFGEGHDNGSLLAVYAYKAARLDNHSTFLEAQRKADAMAPLWESLHQNPDEHSRIMIALREIVFYDRIRDLK
jgi:hypothetical protein